MTQENEGLGASAADATDRVGGLRPEPTASSQPSGRSPTGAAVERLALNLRAFAYAMGAPRADSDEEVALGAAKLILPKLERGR
jgi:hypothetical protein